MYETKAHGGAGAVVGFFDCPGYIGTADPADEVMAQLSGLSVEQLEEYRDGGWLYGLKVRNPGGCRSLCRWKPCTWTTRRKAGAGLTA